MLGAILPDLVALAFLPHEFVYPWCNVAAASMFRGNAGSFLLPNLGLCGAKDGRLQF
jgi:hypothetical protein